MLSPRLVVTISGTATALPVKPQGSSKLLTPFNHAHLPPIPAVRNEIVRADLILTGPRRDSAGYARWAWYGDLMLGSRSARAVEGCSDISWSGDKHTVKNLLVSNTTLSYLCLAYQLTEIESGTSQKRYADLFEAHIGAIYIQAKADPKKEEEADHFLAELFSPRVWPILAGTSEPTDAL